MLPIRASEDNRRPDAEAGREGWIRALLEGEWRDGVHGRERVHAYKKWGGAHWRLVSLAELGVTRAGAEDAGRAALDEAWDQVVRWLLGEAHLANVPLIRGRYRRCGSQEGNALWASSVMGLGTADDRGRLASNLLRWQWPDGGWNCDKRPAAAHSSFNESLPPLRGLAAHRRRAAEAGNESGAADLDAAIDAAAEFFLAHRVVESHRRPGVIGHPRVVELAWPPYWHYGLLPGLRALHEAGRLGDPRAAPAIERLEAKREPDGTWTADRRYWRRGRAGTGTELVNWGADGESAMLTAQAREVLAAPRS